MDRWAQEQHRRDTKASKRFFTKEWRDMQDRHGSEAADLQDYFDERDTRASELGLSPPNRSARFWEQRKMNDRFRSEERHLADAEAEDLKQIDDRYFGPDERGP